MGVVGTGVERVQHVESMPGVEQVDPRLASPTSSPRASTIPTARASASARSRSAPERRSRSSPGPARSSRASRCSRRRAGSSARARRSCAAARSSRGPRRTRSRASGVEALELLAEAREETGLPVVSEVTDPGDVPLFERVRRHAPGRRPEHGELRAPAAVGQSRKPVLLKRGLSSTIEEWLMAAEYVLSSGNPNVVLCERGIRTFETATRNTLDLSAVPVAPRADPPAGHGRPLARHRPPAARPPAVGRRLRRWGPTASSSRSTLIRPGRSRTPSSRSRSPSSATSWTTSGARSTCDGRRRPARRRRPRRRSSGPVCASASTTSTRASRRCSRSAPSSRSRSSRRDRPTTTATTSSGSASSSSVPRRRMAAC